MIENPESKTRKQIFDLVVKNPGIYLSKIAELLGLPISEVKYYLNAMETDGEVSSSQEGGYTRYFPQKIGKKSTRIRKTQDIHDSIYQLLLKNPGLHQSKIAELLDMSAQLAKYHLLYMERKNLVVGIKEEGAYYRRFYVKDSEVGTDEKKYVDLLRQKHLFRIVVIILRNPGIQHKEIAQKMGIHPSTLTHHIIKLNDNGIVDVQTYGRDKGYRIHDRKKIIRIMRTYISNAITNGFKDIWDDINIKL